MGQPKRPGVRERELRSIASEELLTQTITNLNLQHVLAGQAGAPDWSLEKTFVELSKKVDVSETSDPSLFAISAKNANPNVAANIANAIAGTYLEWRAQMWQALRGSRPGPAPAFDLGTIQDMARPRWNSCVQTKAKTFLTWILGGTFLALVAGGAALACHPQVRSKAGLLNHQCLQNRPWPQNGPTPISC